MKGAIHHSPLHIHVVQIYFYCSVIIIIIIIITSTYDKNLNVFSGSLSLFAATDSLTLKIMAIVRIYAKAHQLLNFHTLHNRWHQIYAVLAINVFRLGFKFCPSSMSIAGY
jgi:hypothetical protein